VAPDGLSTGGVRDWSLGCSRVLVGFTDKFENTREWSQQVSEWM